MAWRGAGSLSRSIAPHPSASASPSPLYFHSSPPSVTPSLLCPFQSFLPLHSLVPTACLTSHLTVNVRACCDLSNVAPPLQVLERPWISTANRASELRESDAKAVLAVSSCRHDPLYRHVWGAITAPTLRFGGFPRGQNPWSSSG
ncbi:hypothetical protein V6N13_036737 [Hibiscus sabdariffa]|uniref:Uncharacterized protein n=1 Tax=Hibiscus sabdariffa TaxID=183260 RepID=A0ABR2S5L5_9ROSI